MATDGFVDIPAGAFRMGATDAPHPEDGEAPRRNVELSPYSIARKAVHVDRFARFIAATGYVTTAEQRGGSLVFQGQLAHPQDHPTPDPVAPWWRWVEGANWRFPFGEDALAPETEEDAALKPVVHVSHDDARAFCGWARSRLPTEAEWERAASYLPPPHPHIWSGAFPYAPTKTPGPRQAADGEANGFGLVHACGNVWEWTADRFATLHPARLTVDPGGPLNGGRRVLKGGSFLCCPSYCARFRPSSRRGEPPTATASHTGFREAADIV